MVKLKGDIMNIMILQGQKFLGRHLDQLRIGLALVLHSMAQQYKYSQEGPPRILLQLLLPTFLKRNLCIPLFSNDLISETKKDLRPHDPRLGSASRPCYQCKKRSAKFQSCSDLLLPYPTQLEVCYCSAWLRGVLAFHLS